MEVGARTCVLGVACCSDPVDGLAAGIGRLDYSLGLVSATEASDSHSTQLGVGHVGNIHVE
jgi:hypothetical protein